MTPHAFPTARVLSHACGSPALLSLAVIAILCCTAGAFAQKQSGKEKLGRLFIKATPVVVEGQQLPDAEREDSVKDMKKRPNKFILADKEEEADFLIVVNERNSTPMSGRPSSKNLNATLYARDSGEWKPAAALKSTDNMYWSVAAEDIVKKAAKWVKENVKNQ